jgi:PEP-CTERM motif
MLNLIRVIRTATAVGVLALPALASAQTWANWTAASVSGNTMSGMLGSTTISYSGTFDGYQLSDGVTRTGSVGPAGSCGFNFYSCLPNPYVSSGVGAPTNEGFIQYTRIHRGTISFGSAVVNPLIAFISVGGGNSVRYDFLGNSFNVLSNNNAGNPAAWGSGTHSVAGNVLTGTEFSGTIQFIGSFTSISYSVDDAENWHGLTVGVQSVQSVVPEPSTYALMGAGLLALGVAARRRRKI